MPLNIGTLWVTVRNAVPYAPRKQLWEGRHRVPVWKRQSPKFACFCGRPLQFDTTIHRGTDSDGEALNAGHCSEHGWVGSDGKSRAVSVTPVRDP